MERGRFSKFREPTPFHSPTRTHYHTPFEQPFGATNQTVRFASLKRVAGSVINYYNAEDFALKGWLLINNEIRGGTDPTSALGSGFQNARYTWRNPNPLGVEPYDLVRTQPNSPDALLSLPTNAYEMFAHGFFSLSAAIGASPAALPAFTKIVDLNNDQDTLRLGGEGRGHSAQYIGNNIRVQRYWEHVKADAGF
jgi:hypothetical protein